MSPRLDSSTLRGMKVTRRTVLLALGIAVVAAVGAGVVLVLASRGGDENATAPAATAVAAPVRAALLRGVPQDGATLGDPQAPALYEYADLQCPYCAVFSKQLLPTLVRDYVRPGKVKLVFNGLAFLGPDSVTALQAVYAAGRQDRAWDVLEALFERQGAENSGWVTQGLLDEVGGNAGLDTARWNDEMMSNEVVAAMTAAQQAATQHGVRGTPALVFAGQHVPLANLDPQSLHRALDPLLAE